MSSPRLPSVNKRCADGGYAVDVWSQRREYSVAQVAVFSGPAFVWAEAACALLRRIGKPYILCLHGGNLPQFAQASGQRLRSSFRRPTW